MPQSSLTPQSGNGGPGSPNQSKRRTPWRSTQFLLPLIIFLGLNLLVANVLFPPAQATVITVPYNVFVKDVKAGDVVSITSTSNTITGTFRHKTGVSATSKTKALHFATQRPTFAADNLEALLAQHNVTINAQNPNPPTSFLVELLYSFGPTLLFVLIFLWFIRRSTQNAGGGLFSLGRSKARLYDPERPATTFQDVAGIEEAKEELEEIVDFLKQPGKYQRLGGTVPKGVLLIGLPGTGKTLLAKAVAGEAGVPFFSMSASEFIEMVVGVGASRVRDLFAKAREAAPAIIFVDELDAIGRSRSSGPSFGGHDEREQTLNQILTEMDGFDSREGVIVLAATNRADVLDAALLRPGRFDRRVMVHPPDRVGRAAILRIHTRGVPLGPDIDLDNLASQTPGLVGAELRNLVNEAALLAARKDRAAVTMEDFSDSLEKVLLGTARRIVLSAEDRERTAYHESGHALLGLLVPAADPVRRVSIVPRGRALGVTVQSPVDDRQNYPETYLRARMVGALGGRAAEKLIYDVVTTGAESDLQQVTSIARQMVVHWGMSPRVGPLNLGEDQDQSQMMISQRPYSEATAEVIDSEVRRIVEECFDEALHLLSDNKEKLVTLTTALLREDSLNEEEILQVTGLPPKPGPIVPLAGEQNGKLAAPDPAPTPAVPSNT
jgi:cell division protease FtsH